MKPKPGDFFVARDGRGFVEIMIEVMCLSSYYHAGIYIGDGKVIEAASNGVREANLSEYNPQSLLWSQRKLSALQRRKICLYAKDQIGKPYSFIDLVALALSRWHITPAWVWNRLSRSDRVICSQLVANSYFAAGINLVDKPRCRITPGDLADVVLHEPIPEDL